MDMTTGGSVSTARHRRFEEVVDVVFEPLQRYLGRRVSPSDGDEVLGDVLLVLWRRLDDVPVTDPLPWCYGVARRCVANHRRGDDRRSRLLRKLSISYVAPTEVDASTGADEGPGDPDLIRALAELPERDREIMRLWAWEELAPREIATVLDMAPNAVSLRLSRAKRRLRQSLERHDRTHGGHTRGADPGRHPS